MGLHGFVAVHAHYMHRFGGSYAVSTAGAEIFDAVAVRVAVAALWLACGVSCSFAARCVAAFDAVHVDVIPALRNNKLTKGFCRLGDAPADARVITNFEVAGFGGLFELFVVVCAAPAAILYTILHIVNMYALVEF